MKTPICEICARTDTMCGSCETRLRGGEINQADVEISKLLYKKYAEIDAEYLSSFLTRNFAILSFRGNAGAIVGRGGRGAAEISTMISRKVKIINLDNDTKKIISDILHPAILVGINEIFATDGEIYKVRIRKKDFPRLPIDLGSLEKLFMNILSKRVRIVFE